MTHRGLRGWRGRLLATGAAHPGTVVALALAVVLEGGYLLLQPQAPDLPAQLARASAVSRGVGLWWAGWYGGINTSTYSLVSAHLMNSLGVAAVGVLSTAVLCVCGALLVRTSARPRAGAAALACAACANLYSGRITFAAGMAVVLASFVCLQRGARRSGLLLAAVSGLVSPLAALCHVVGSSALLLARPAEARRHLVAIAAAAAPVAAISLVFGQSSYMPFSADLCVGAVLTCLGVLVAPVHRQVRALAVVSAVLAVGAYAVHSPVGSNAARMPMLAAGPLVVATARRPRVRAREAALTAALLAWPLYSLSTDMAVAASPSSQADFYAPLLHQLPARGTSTARVEVLDPLSHGASYYLSTQVPLARGWERQVDAADNPLFYGGPIAADTYRRWLDRHGVGWVAEPRDAELDYGSLTERDLLARGVPYLRPVWSSSSWVLYRVVDPAPIATGVLTATALTDTGVTLRAATAGSGTVELAYSRLLVVRSATDGTVTGCVAPGPDGLSVVTVPAPGPYVLGGDLSALAARSCTS